jgi:GT2 family glycosyltransferase
MSTTRDVTVVVPTFRRPHLLERLLDALEAQTFPNDRFDVVVVDNASPDDTSERLAKFAARTPLAFRHLVQTVPGPAATRNKGWRATSAPIVAFVDDDCVPEPDWLENGLAAIARDDSLGVVQGCTRKPEGEPTYYWSLWREITGPTPYFEACNIFYRRRALEQTGGFDEDIAYYGEDAALGWAVVDAGWRRGYAPDAVAYHDVEERGLRYHVKTGLLERNIALMAKRHPQFRRDAFWRPWAFRPENAAFTLAVAGVALSWWRRPALVLVVPYLRLRLPPAGHPDRLRLFLQRVVVDGAQFAGMRMGSLRYRLAVL